MGRPRGYYAKRDKAARERQILYDIAYVRNLKSKTNKKHNKTETESQIQRIKRWLLEGRGVGEERSR